MLKVTKNGNYVGMLVVGVDVIPTLAQRLKMVEQGYKFEVVK